MTPAFDLIPAGFDLIKYVDCCVEYLVTHSIDVIIALNDIAALITSAIGKEMKARHGIRLNVPSVHAAILCGHKLKTREVR